MKKRAKKVQKNELPEILIYQKKKYILPGALLLFFALLLLSFVITLSTAGSAGEDIAEMLELPNMIYRIAYNFGYLLPGFVILGIPALLLYAVIHIGERRFLRIYQSMPEPAKQKLGRMKSRNLFLRGLGFYEAEGYILFHDRCVFGTPQIARIDDIVWGYLGRSDIQYSNVEININMPPSLQFFSLCFYTKDGRRHRIFASMSYKEVVWWFTTRCPRAILGYGKEQKKQAEEIFRREAEQKAFLMGDEKDSYLIRKRRRILVMTAGCVLAGILLVSGIYIREYRNSDTYLYRKNMKEADRYFAKEEWSRAYQAYYKARDCRMDDEEATKGMLLSCLGMAKNDGYIDSIIRDYENLFYHQDLFTDETDISGWYFDCADYYLKYDDPLGAMELLERGMETFAREETVVGDVGNEDEDALIDWKKGKEVSEKTEKKENEESKEEQDIREDILQKMQEKKDDIFAHCQIEAVTEYSKGVIEKYTQYDEQDREILCIKYLGGERFTSWESKYYEKDGKVISKEVWGQRVDEEKKIKAEKTIYDEKGNEIYYEEYYWGTLVCKRECCVLSDTLRIDRVYESGLEDEGVVRYMESKSDNNGNLLEQAFYRDSYTVEEIQEGIAPAELRYYYTYDQKGNCLREECLEESGKCYPVNEWEYDNENNLIKKIHFDCYNEKIFEYTTTWHYNEKNLPTEKKEQLILDGEEHGTELYIFYYEADRVIREEYTGLYRYSAIKEYDLLGNQIKEYRISGGKEDVPEEKQLYAEWKYQYRYIIE